MGTPRESLPPHLRDAVERAEQPGRHISRDKVTPRVTAHAITQPRRDGAMNKTEAAYAAHLIQRRAAGEISRFDFEPVKLRLADRTYYTPDFRVILPDGLIEYHEVKGFWEDDARVKIKVAAEQHPYQFIAVQRKRGAWVYERF